MKNTERTMSAPLLRHCPPLPEPPRAISSTPDWGSFFELAKQLVQSGLAKDQGRELVLEMLEYGKKLDKTKETTNDKAN